MATVRSISRGAALSVIGALLVLGAALVMGLIDSSPFWVFLVGMGAGVIVGLVERGPARIEAVGAAGIGILAVASGLMSGWGWLETAGVAGSLAALLWTVAGQRLPRWRWDWFRWGGVMIPLIVFIVLPLVLNGGTLGHDEAAYGVKAKSWLEGTPDTGWSRHRATGMSVYGYVVLAIGGAEGGLRMIGLAGLLALIVGVWVLGDRMGNPRVAALAAIGIVAGPALLRRGTEYLSDVPSAALLVFGMVIVWREFAMRDLPTYRLLWFLPLAWVAFYLRYQSLLSIGLIGVVTLILWWPKIKTRPGPLMALAVVGVVGLIPHALEAMDFGGTPWAILAYTGGIAERAYVGEGLVDYAALMAWPLAGFVGPVASIAALGGLIGQWQDPKFRERYLFLLVPAILQVLALGLLSHGEPRFVFFPLALVMVAGALSVDSWLAGRAGRGVEAVALGLGMLLFGSLVLATGSVRRGVENRAAVNQPIELAAEEASTISGEDTCAVMTTPAPQVTYYSECSTRIFHPGADPIQEVDALDGDNKYMILVEAGRRQPNEAELAALVDLTVGEPILIEEERVAAVYTFED